MLAAIIGLEVVKLGELDDGSPWRMTVDAMTEDNIMRRYQVTGHYNGELGAAPERTLDDVASVLHGSVVARMHMAAGLDRLDRQAATEILPIIEVLLQEQRRLLLG